MGERRSTVATAALRWLPAAWAWILAVLVLGPALGAITGGLVLSYDLVWVPDLALTPTALGLGSGLPRAVPSDALVAVLDEVVPAGVLEAGVLLSALAAGGVGAGRLLRGRSTVARLTAVTVWVWNPLVVERLVIGHWPVLVGYAVLPWVMVAGIEHRTSGRLPARVWLLVPLGCLSAGAGIATTVALLATGATRRRGWWLLGPVVVGNAPWVVAGLLHAGLATSDPAGATVFALHGEGSLPGPVAALSLGGIWNAEVVPASRTGPLGIAFTLTLLALVAAGASTWWRRREPGRGGLVVAWAVGYLLAVLTWSAPGVVGWVAATVPGGGLLRDGARALVLCAPLLAVLAGEGADRIGCLVAQTTRRHALGPAPVVLTGLLLVGWPLVLLPDAAGGAGGRLAPVTYPASWERARAAVAAPAASEGDVLVLPLSSYRRPAWNHDGKVLDPLPRFLGRESVAADELAVGDTTVAGEDPRAARAARALALATPTDRAASLAADGIGVVVTDPTAPGPVVEVAGERVLDGGSTGPSVVVLAAPTELSASAADKAAMGLAWVVWTGAMALGALAIGAPLATSRVLDLLAGTVRSRGRRRRSA